MDNGNPIGEVRPMIDREPPNAAETRGASVRTRFCETSGEGSGRRSLAHRSGTAHCRLSEAGNWGISVKAFGRTTMASVWFACAVSLAAILIPVDNLNAYCGFCHEMQVAERDEDLAEARRIAKEVSLYSFTPRFWAHMILEVFSIALSFVGIALAIAGVWWGFWGWRIDLSGHPRIER